MESTQTTRRTALQFLSTLSVLAVGVDRTVAQNERQGPDTSWPMFGSDSQNTGSTDASGPLSNVDQRWSTDVGASRHPSPAIVDGTVYVGGTDGLFALSATDGSTRWRYNQAPGDDPQYTGPAVVDGTVYSGHDEGYFVAVDAVTGEEEWRNQVEWMPIRSPVFLPAAVTNGQVYTVVATFGSQDWLYAFDAESGSEQSDRGALNTSLSAPAVDASIFVYGSRDTDGSIIARRVPSWQHAWSRHLSEGDILAEVEAAPAIYRGTVFIGREDGILFALDRDSGEERWRFSEPNELTLSPAAADGTIIVAGNSRLYALAADSGELLWTQDCSPHSSPVIANDAVYVAADEGDDFGVLAVEFETGERITKLDVDQSYDPSHYIGGESYLNPVRIAVTDGWVYGHSRFGDVFALSGDSQRPSKFTITAFEPVDGTAKTGRNLDTTVTVENTGQQPGTQQLVYRIDGEIVETREIELAAGESTTVKFVEVENTQFSGEVSHSVETDDDTASGTLSFELPSDESEEDNSADSSTGTDDESADSGTDSQSDDSQPDDGSSSDEDGSNGAGGAVGVLFAAGVLHFIERWRGSTDDDMGPNGE